jgi:hypothetical protein
MNPIKIRKFKIISNQSSRRKSPAKKIIILCITRFVAFTIFTRVVFFVNTHMVFGANKIMNFRHFLLE